MSLVGFPIDAYVNIMSAYPIFCVAWSPIAAGRRQAAELPEAAPPAEKYK
jgi:hypothetical protein